MDIEEMQRLSGLTETLSKKGLERAWTELAIALAQAPRLAGTVRQALGERSGLQASLSRIAKQVADANKEFQGLHREFTKEMAGR